MTLIRKTTTFLQNVNTSAIKDLKVIGEIGENILTGIGNVLTSSSKDVDIDSPNKDPNFDVKKVSIVCFFVEHNRLKISVSKYLQYRWFRFFIVPNKPTRAYYLDIHIKI